MVHGAEERWEENMSIDSVIREDLSPTASRVIFRVACDLHFSALSLVHRLILCGVEDSDFLLRSSIESGLDVIFCELQKRFRVTYGRLNLSETRLQVVRRPPFLARQRAR